MRARCLIGAAVAAVAHAGQAPGFVYGMATNGTTNELGLTRVDLQTFEVLPIGPQLASAEVIGSAAYIQPSTTLLWFCLLQDPGLYLAGIDINTGVITKRFDTANWLSSGHVFVDGIFAGGNASALFVVGTHAGTGEQLLFDVNTVSGAVSSRGAVSTGGGEDATFDPASGLLYQIITSGADDDSGNLTVIDTTVSPPALTAVIPLSDFFSLPQWDAKQGALVGLALWQPDSSDYARNLTLLYPQGGSYNTTSHGALGSFYAEFDGPKAFDSVNRRAFYLIATSPMGEMDLVTVSIDSNPALVLESPGWCGFVGYCPQAMAYFNAADHPEYS